MSDNVVQPSRAPQTYIEKAPDFRIIYSNAFQYRVTLSDITLTFGILAENPMIPNATVVRQDIAVTMSIAQAKNLAEYLVMIISRYEREIGPVVGIGKSPPAETETDAIFDVLRQIGTR